MERMTSRRSQAAIHIRRLGADKSYREQCREFLCDGAKLLEEAVKSDTEIIDVVTASHILFPLPVETRVYYATQDIINSLSPLKSAQDTLFTCKMPPTGGFAYNEAMYSEGQQARTQYTQTQYTGTQYTGTQYSNEQYCEGLHILLDGIQDPGNLGTILRTAEAFRIDSVLLTGNCADLYNPKTVRATMGAIFRQKALTVDLSVLTKLKEAGAVFVGASLESGRTGISGISFRNKIVAIGSEGKGLSSGVTSLCGELFSIPMAPECESLNAAVAAAIVMWEAARTEFYGQAVI